MFAKLEKIFAKLSEVKWVFETYKSLRKNCDFDKQSMFSKNTKSQEHFSKLYNIESLPKVEVLFFLIQERKDWVHDP